MKGKSNVERQGKESSEKGHHKKKEGEWEKREEEEEAHQSVGHVVAHAQQLSKENRALHWNPQLLRV